MSKLKNILYVLLLIFVFGISTNIYASESVYIRSI